ncbi:MAG TPA: hypothetical protein VG186_11965 [Solirubrobacteraceae bacterium]|nr:hypothetical protein [Solirubrobacteraceae bacterium]
MPKLPSERDWARAAVLEPRPGPRYPELISDGGGLPFPPAALAGPAQPLDPEDPAAAALLSHLTARAAPKRTSRVPWMRSTEPPPPPGSLEGWRQLARTEDEVFFALGLPPRMLTAALRRAGRRRTWTFVGSSAARPLRVARDGIRASSWRLDPTHEPEPEPEATTLRLLVTEQAYASGQRADGRILPPEIYLDDDELVLTVFVTPPRGFQNGTPNPETPVLVALAHPVGARQLIDGALPLG